MLACLAAPSVASASTRGAEAIQNLRLIDYFPSSAGWGSMWWRWNPTQMEGDFRRISELHANAVRIIVSAPALGFPHPGAQMLTRLTQTIELAQKDGLRVELTLFNEWQNYSAIAESESWAREVLAPLHGDPEIAYLDLHDELPVATNHAAAAWAQAMVPFVQSIDGGIPVTVSASISSGVAPLQALVRTLASSPPDLYDVHYFGAAADAYAILAQARQAVGATPLFVGETGFATDPSYGWARGLQPDANSLETYQDYYYRMVESATRALSLPPAAPWILYDMPGQGGTRWGYHMGILRSNGEPKPAASALAGAFSGEALSGSFNNGFETGTREPAVWRRWLPREASFALDHTVAHSGSASARISQSTGKHLVGCPAFYVAPIAAVHQGVTYTASAWVRGRNAAGSSRVVLSWTDASGHFVASSPSPPLPSGTTGWTRLTSSATPPPGAAAVEIDLQVCENPGTTWFDDVSFSPAAEAASRFARRHRAR